jgi:hypothetical protein
MSIKKPLSKSPGSARYKPSVGMMGLIDGRESKRVRKYRIICLKRSTFAARGPDDYISDWYKASSLVYWMDNYSGYTNSKHDAGLYTLKELDGAAGSHGDWLVEPVWVDDEE